MVEVARRRVAPVVPTVAQTEAASPDAAEETEAAAIAAASAAPPSIGAAAPAELKMIAKVSEGQRRSAKGSKCQRRSANVEIWEMMGDHAPEGERLSLLRTQPWQEASEEHCKGDCLRDAGCRYGEIRACKGRYGEIRGDTGRYGSPRTCEMPVASAAPATPMLRGLKMKSGSLREGWEQRRVSRGGRVRWECGLGRGVGGVGGSRKI